MSYSTSRRHISTCIVALLFCFALLVALSGGLVRAQQSPPPMLSADDALWSDGFGMPGTAGAVSAVATSGTTVYVAGDFPVVEGVAATGLVSWDGNAWRDLGANLRFTTIETMVVGADGLYVGGIFQTIGGVTTSNIARWDGSAWHALGAGVDGLVYDLAVSGGDLFVAGDFSSAGGTAANNVARWDGSAWHALGSGLTGSGSFIKADAIVAGGGLVYVAGEFSSAGGQPANSIARWDGTGWSALGVGFDDISVIEDLALDGSTLYVAGSLRQGGASVPGLARWSGGAWGQIGSGNVRSIAISGGKIVMAGSFADGADLAVWDGSSLRRALGFFEGTLRKATVGQGGVYLSGAFVSIASGASNIALFNPDTEAFSPVGAATPHGVAGTVWSLASRGQDVFVGGVFRNVGGQAIRAIARWNGAAWSAVGGEIDGVVLALAATETRLYAAGDFTAAGGQAASNIAVWDGSNWTPLGAGLNGSVWALAPSGSRLYAAGSFTQAGGQPANRIAVWDGSSWTSLGAGLNSDVYALAVTGDNLFVGGRFSQAGGQPASRMARWDGSGWSAVGGGFNNTVFALAADGGTLYAGGSFTQVTGGAPASRIARWDGSAWAQVGAGVDGRVNTITLRGQSLYIGGEFFSSGSLGASTILPSIARWDGSAWQPLGNGVRGLGTAVRSIAFAGDRLYVGGFFSNAGGKAAGSFAAWDVSATPQPGPSNKLYLPLLRR